MCYMNRRSYPRGLSVFVSEEMDDTIRAIHARDGGGLSDVIRDLLDEALEARADAAVTFSEQSARRSD